ncbi:transcriptional regulator [Streptomyces sp. NPDC054864]
MSAVITLLPGPRPAAKDGAAPAPPVLYVPGASQWLPVATGRIATDGYSWMQAVHWVAGSGLYEPRRHRSHGPRAFGRTTILVAQELAQLFPCRPGIVYLVRRTGLSERSVEYHLGMLRETGLLAYIVLGNRVRGEAAQASEFARMIPAAFDVALGIRTVLRDEDAPAYTRVAIGIAESGRKLMAKLGRKASRSIRKPRAKAPSMPPTDRARKGVNRARVTGVSSGPRCTPMQVGSPTRSSAGDTSFPPESKLASGQSKSPTPTKPKRGRRKCNAIGRRFQLAGELIRQVPWMGRAAVPRTAWILREVADAGWTVTEVIAFLDCSDAPAIVHRPSGFLATRLKTATAEWPTAEGRARAVQAYWDSRRAEGARHQEWEGVWQAPHSESVRRLVTEVFAPRPQQPDEDQSEAPPDQTGIDYQGEQERADLQATAWGEFMSGETTLVTSLVDTLGRPVAERIYGADLVQRALRVASGSRSSRMALGCR